MRSLALVADPTALQPRFVELQLRDFGEKDCLVEMVAAGICATDLHALRSKRTDCPYPYIMGHEGLGIVRETGRQVSQISKDDVVLLLHKPRCGVCSYCSSGRTNLCQAGRASRSRRMHPDGQFKWSSEDGGVGQLMGLGTFAKHAIVDEAMLAPIRPSVLRPEYALLGCCIPTGVGSVRNVAQMEAGSAVAVLGLGAVGQSVVQAAALSGARTIIAAEPNEKRRSLGRDAGCTRVLEHLPASTLGGLAGQFDYVFDCVASAETLAAAVQLAHEAWGAVILIGMGADARSAGHCVQPGDLLGRTICASTFGGYSGREWVQGLVEECQGKHLKLDLIMTEALPFEQALEGLQLATTGQVMRILLSFS